MPAPPQHNAEAQGAQPPAWWGTLAVGAGLCVILAVGCAARFVMLGSESFWYDEVVTMRLARASSPSSMLVLLNQIDASRAPLHPLLLSGWLRAFGASEFSGRSFSATCGIATILVVFAIGRRLGGPIAGLWAAFLTATSPLMIVYDREARMYALLTLLTSLAWWNLLEFRRDSSWFRAVIHAALLAALSYTHPLGVLMSATLGLAAIVDWRRGGWTLPRFLSVHAGWIAAIAPWIMHYLDHAPESTSGRLPLRFLAGLPIGFTGGNSSTLAVFMCLILVGLVPWAIPGLSRRARQETWWPLIVWFLAPPTILYAYSWIGHPIFGPARYNVYVAPAFCLLVGCGLARLRFLAQFAMAWALPGFAMMGLMSEGDRHVRKAAWREAAEFLDKTAPSAPVIVIPPGPGRNFEVEVARYYLGDRRLILPMPGPTVDDALPKLGPRPGLVFFTASLRNVSPVGAVPDELSVDGRVVRHVDFSASLRLFRIKVGPIRDPR